MSVHSRQEEQTPPHCNSLSGFFIPQSRMRIALIQDYLRVGGTETQTVALANAFRRIGHEPVLVTIRPAGPLAPDLAPGIPHLALQLFDLHIDWLAPGLTRTLRRAAPDIILLMGRLANCYGWRLATGLPRTPIVATVRTGKTLPAWYRRTLRTARAVVANSRAAAHAAIAAGASADGVHVIHNAAVRTAPPTRSREAVRAALGSRPDTIVFLCVAMMRPGKGHADLVQAFAQAGPPENCELWLAGDGTERQRIEAVVREKRLAASVRLLGRRNDIPDLYAAADVAVLASTVESLPNFLVEAQWHGLPVIARDAGGVAEAIRPGTTGHLIDREDPAAFAAAIRILAADPELRRRMGAAARDFARSAFTPDRQHQRYLELFRLLTES